MRISTSMVYDLGVGGVQQQYAEMVKIQQQMATGRRMLNPSDDPIAAARALEVSQSQSTNEQFMTNGDYANTALSLQETTLAQAGDMLQNVRVLAVNAGNTLLSNSDRASLATELQGNYDQLMGLANTTDGNGQYLFAGYKGNTAPFSQGAPTVANPGGVNYLGDQGQRMVQISASRQVAVSSSGAEVFQLIKNGNGTFVDAAASSNTGSGIISPGVVLDSNKWNSATNNKDFTIKFDVTAGVTSYDVVDNVNGKSLLTGVAAAVAPYPRTYTSGNAISLSQAGPPAFDFGAELTIAGQPATGDAFTVQASKTNQDVFSTLKSLITALQTPVSGSAGNARLSNDINSALSNIDLGLDNLLTVRSAVGATLKEVETQRSTSDDLATQYKTTLSGLQDLDYAKAISDMALKQAGLDAAQKSFLKVQGLSLFNYINP